MSCIARYCLGWIALVGGIVFAAGSAIAQQPVAAPVIADHAAATCCDTCRQSPCRCRLRRQIVSPNRFRVAPCPTPADGCDAVPIVTPEAMPNQPAVENELNPDPANPLAATEPAVSATPSPDSFALSSGMGSGFQSSAADVATIGDFFAGGSIITGPSWGQVPIVLPVAGGDRRYKLTEHTSPIPTDRMFFDYHVFNNAVVDANNNQLDVNRYVFGFERTFGQGNMSLEIRLPIANGADSQQVQNIGGPALQANEFGNLSLTSKFLLYRDSLYAVSSGLGIIFPTAAEAELIAENATTSVLITNDAYHLQPFFAVQRFFSPSTWATFYTQADFAAASNTVTSYADGGVVAEDQYTDQNLLFLDFSFGRWFYRNDQSRALRGIAGLLELHYTSTMTDTDVAFAGNPSIFDSNPPADGTSQDIISNPYNRLDVLNGTAGLRFQCGPQTILTVAGVAPLRGNEEALFDGEFVLQLSRRR